MLEWEVICNDEVLSDGVCTARAKIHGGWLVSNLIETLDGQQSSSLVFVPDIHHCWKTGGEL